MMKLVDTVLTSCTWIRLRAPNDHGRHLSISLYPTRNTHAQHGASSTSGCEKTTAIDREAELQLYARAKVPTPMPVSSTRVDLV